MTEKIYQGLVPDIQEQEAIIIHYFGWKKYTILDRSVKLIADLVNFLLACNSLFVRSGG